MLESGSGAETLGAFALDEVHLENGTVLLAVHGDADQHVAADLEDRLSDVIDDGASSVVLDLSATTFLDSMALGILLHGMKRLHARGGSLRVVVARPDIRRIFEVTLLDRVFDLDGSREEALAAAQGMGS
jgi:anti-sigma B factor antagonist